MRAELELEEGLPGHRSTEEGGGLMPDIVLPQPLSSSPASQGLGPADADIVLLSTEVSLPGPTQDRQGQRVDLGACGGHCAGQTINSRQ